MNKSLLVVVENPTHTRGMSILTAIVVLSLLLVAGLAPWWVAGRHIDTRGERVALRDLGVDGVINTLRRGANMYVPTQFQNTHA